MSVLKLFYFDCPGRGDLARMMLHYSGEEFTDFRITEESWHIIKKEIPFNRVPVLEIDLTETIPETGAIIRYLARRFNLYGKSDIERARCDAALCVIEKSMFKAIDAINDCSADRAIIFENYVTEELPKLVDTYKRFAASFGANGFVIGDSLTCVDFAIYSFVFVINLLARREFVVDEFLTNNTTRLIENLPQLKEYFSKRPSNKELLAKLEAVSGVHNSR